MCDKRLFLVVAFILVIVGASPRAIAGGRNSRPKGQLNPPTPELKAVSTLVSSGQLDEALKKLSALSPHSELERGWEDYLHGLISYGQKNLERGLASFMAPYDRLKANTNAVADEDLFRLAALCLKKVGWFYRNQKNPQMANAYHSIEYAYDSEHGSFEEYHDSLISLDNDAYAMNDAHLEKIWLLKSLEVAGQISDMTARHRALGMSYNNLAGARSALHEFPESEKAAAKALENWKAYETRAGHQEFREAWAQFGLGDVYEDWMADLKKGSRPGCQEKRQKAIDAFSKGQILAQTQGMPKPDLEKFEKRLTDAKNSPCPSSAPKK